jgi:tRNA (guanine10-N2)-methyltransferase
MSYHDLLEWFNSLHDCRSVSEFYGQGFSYQALHIANRQNETLWHRYIKDTSFRFQVTAYNHTIPQSRQRDVIESFAYMGFLGKIDMKTPDITLTCLEECAYVPPSIIFTAAFHIIYR